MYYCSCGWFGSDPLVFGDVTKWYGCPKCLKPIPNNANSTTDDGAVDWLINMMGMKK